MLDVLWPAFACHEGGALSEPTISSTCRCAQELRDSQIEVKASVQGEPLELVSDNARLLSAVASTSRSEAQKDEIAILFFPFCPYACAMSATATATATALARRRCRC